MRVLIITLKRPPAIGGMESWLADLIRRLSIRHRIAVLGSEEDRLDRLLDLGADAVVGVPSLESRSTREPLVLTRDILDHVKRFAPDLVHLTESGLAFLLPDLERRGIPAVVTVHGGDLTRPWLWLHDRGEARSVALRQCLQRATRVTAISRFSKRLAESAGAPLPVARVPVGVDTDRFHPGDRTAARRCLDLPLARPIVLSVARLVPRKGHIHALAALAALRERDPLYLVAGSGPLGDQLAENVEALRLQRHVMLLGQVDPDRLRALYQSSDVFLLPACDHRDERGWSFEGFGIVFLEAAACGLPCVGTRTGGIPDAVADGVTGFTVAPDNPAALTAAVAGLLDDPELAARMGQAGRERAVSQFTVAHMARRYEAIYQEAVAARRDGAGARA